MNEKQFPQIPNELVSCCRFSLDMFQHVMEMEEMCRFNDFDNLYFLLKPDCQVEFIRNKCIVAFLTDLNQ